MGRKSKITAQTKTRIIRLKKRNPHLGVRRISEILQKNYKVDISKSAVSQILRATGQEAARGRKKSLLLYKRKAIEECGLLLLRSMDSELNLFDYLTKELASHFPKIEYTSLKKVIILVSFSAFLGWDLKEKGSQDALLRVADLYNFPSRKVSNFVKVVTKTKPRVSLEALRDSLQSVSTVKFSFANGYEGYCDGGLSTFWEGPCFVKDFFTSLDRARKTLEAMIKENVVRVSYTKSFDYLSSATFDFISGLSKGIKKIELLGENGETIEEVSLDLREEKIFKPSFFIGYYPRALAKGAVFLEKRGRFKKLNLIDEDFFYTGVVSRVLQSDTKGLILNNVILKRRRDGLVSWGFFTNKRKSLDRLIKKYVYLWPSMEEGFLEEIKGRAKRPAVPRRELKDFLPQELTIDSAQSLRALVDILSELFKERIEDINLKGKEGNIVLGKDFCKVFIGGFSRQIKKIFNNSCLYLDKRRSFLG
ncbi:MAG: helix-turn-helix domain-containing protein [Candidatus Omnitrophota bacterium]|nr:MAG: helix-turn-helix domain-containing protein [Candidatus Omnitrophota bacterium]